MTVTVPITQRASTSLVLLDSLARRVSLQGERINATSVFNYKQLVELDDVVYCTPIALYPV